MKTTVLGIFFVAWSISFPAAVHVVNNNASNPGQFSSLQTAIDTALPGDTLHIQPSPSSYGNVSLGKSLTLIGIGFNPLKDIPFTSRIGDIVFPAGTNEDITLIGLKIGAMSCACAAYTTYSLNNLTIRNCEFDNLSTAGFDYCYAGYIVCNDLLVENCVVHQVSHGVYGNNILYQNNIIYKPYNTSFWLGTSMTNVLVKNNLFMNNAPTSNLIANGAVFENNIFFRFSANGPGPGYVANCVFNNNLTYLTENDLIVGGSNTGNNNVTAQDPLFVNLNLNDANLFQPLLYNYRLQELSPGNDAGTDATDIGPYGNNIEFSETGENVALPVVREMDLLNSTVPSSGTITVHVKATKAKTN